MELFDQCFARRAVWAQWMARIGARHSPQTAWSSVDADWRHDYSGARMESPSYEHWRCTAWHRNYHDAIDSLPREMAPHVGYVACPALAAAAGWPVLRSLPIASPSVTGIGPQNIAPRAVCDVLWWMHETAFADPHHGAGRFFEIVAALRELDRATMTSARAALALGGNAAAVAVVMATARARAA